MKHDAFKPHNDWRDRNWTYARLGYRRGTWHWPYRHEWHGRGHSLKVYRIAFSVLAFIAALILSAFVVMLIAELIAN